MTLSIRPVIEQDIPEIEEIEKEAFPTLWPRTPFKRDMYNKRIGYLVVTELEDSCKSVDSEIETNTSIPFSKKPNLYQRLSRTIQSTLFHENPPMKTLAQPLGFVSVWFLSDDAHITAIAVRSSWRGSGLGELLMIGGIEAAMSRNSRVVTLEVRVSNSVAISLYEKYGFKKIGIRKGYYNDNREDAVIMTTEPIRSLSYENRFAKLCQEYSHRHFDLNLAMKDPTLSFQSTGML